MIRLRGFPRTAIKHEVPKLPDPILHKIEIYVPNNDETQRNEVTRVFRGFAERFGGASIIKAVGGWVMDDGTLATDEIAIVYSFIRLITPAIQKSLRLEAERVRDTLGEEAVTIVIDGGVRFV